MELQNNYPKRPSVVPGANSFKTEKSILNHAPSQEFTASFDYVIVFPMIEVKKDNGGVREQSPVAKHVMHAMLSAGLEIYPYLSVQDDELLVLFRCPLDVLQRFADVIDYKLKLDPAVLEETLLQGDPEKRIAPIKITHDVNITPITPYEHGEQILAFQFQTFPFLIVLLILQST